VGTSESVTAPQPALAQVQPKITAKAYAPPVERNYTFSTCTHKVSHEFRKNVKRLAGSLKVCLLGADSTEEVLVSFEKMKVKPAQGAPMKFNIDETTVNLLDSAQLSSVLGDAELPEGVYKYMEFYVKSAQVVNDGKTYNMLVPSKRVRFFGSFEIKEGYTTVLTVKFLHRIIKWKVFGKQFYMLIPIVKISSTLELKPVDPAITDGDINGSVENIVDAGKVEGVNVYLEGTNFTTTTAADGSFSFTQVPAGLYTLKANHPDYLDYSFQVEVVAGQAAEVAVQLHPAVIRSNVANTGNFADIWPFADANGMYAEVSMETPIKIDFVSLAFTKAEIKFNGIYNAPGAAQFQAYLGVSQQVSASTDLGSWWVGNSAAFENYLGVFYARTEGSEYTVDVTDLIRNNPSSAYYLAAYNLDMIDIALHDIQLSIYYR